MMRSHTPAYRWRGERVIRQSSVCAHHTPAQGRGQVERRESQSHSSVALTTQQLQVKRRESHRANQVECAHHTQLQVERTERHRANQCMCSPHSSYRWRGRERVIEPIKCMRSPHTSYRWRGERVMRPIKCMRSPTSSYRWRGERDIEPIKWMR